MATVVALAGGGSAAAGSGVATAAGGVDGVAATDFVGSAGSGEKSTLLINHAAATTAAATPTPSIMPRDDPIVSGAPRDDTTAS